MFIWVENDLCSFEFIFAVCQNNVEDSRFSGIIRNLIKRSVFQALVSKPQKFLKIFRHFWGTSLFVESWSSTQIFWAPSENSEDEMNNVVKDLWWSSEIYVNWRVFCWTLLILRIFWGSSDFSEDWHVFLLKNGHPQAQNFLRIDWHVFVSKDDHPQNFLRVLSKFWRLTFCFLNDGHPQNFLRIDMFVVERLSSSEFSEDPQKILRISFFVERRIFRIFWGSSEFSEDDCFCSKIIILRIFWGSSECSKDLFLGQRWSPSEFSEGPQIFCF